jgi:hypothetical protein
MANPKWDETEEVAPKFEDTTEVEEGSAGEAFVGGLGQDLSFGLMDELKGVLEAGGQAVGLKGLGKEFGEQEFQSPVGLDLEELLKVYREGRDFEKERIKRLEKESPTAFTAGEYTGMVAPIIATGGAGAIKGLVRTGAKEVAEKGLKEGAEALGKEAMEMATKENLKTAAKTGAGFGALGAAGYSETDALQNPVQFAKEVATGTALGATAGVVLPEAIKVGAKGVKSLGRGIKEGSKSILKLASGLEKKSLNGMLEQADELQKVIHYPEVADRVAKETQKVQANIGKIAEASKEVLSEDKVIPKDTIVELLQNRIKKLMDTPQEGAIPKIQKILDRIDPLTPQRAQKEAYDRLQSKMAKARLQGDVVQGSQREAEKAMAKIQDKQVKMAIEAQQVGERVNFTPPKVEGDRIVVFETVTGKVISEKIKPLKRTPKFSKPKFDPRTNTIRTENLNTGKMIVEEIQTVPMSENVYPEKLISLRDLQEITQDTGKRVYEKDLESEAQKALRTLYHEMSDALKLNAPNEYRHFADEMAKRYKLLEQAEKKLGIKVGYAGKLDYDQDKLVTKLQQVGSETDGYQKTEVEKLLNELQEVQGKEPGKASVVDDLNIKKLQTELERRPDDFNYPVRTMVGSGIGFLAGGGAGAVVGTLAGAAAKPIAREMLRKGKFKKLSMLPSIAQKITDKTAETVAPIVTARGIKAGAENAEEMAEYDYLESLLGDLEASEVPAAQGLREDLLNTLSEDAQKRGAAEFKIQSDPNARKYLKDHREKYEAGGASLVSPNESINEESNQFLRMKQKQSKSSPYSVDHDFMKEQEGMENVGYIPATDGNIRHGENEDNVVIGNSGVTIAAGYDLGQQNLTSLKALKLPKKLENKLKPFLGLKKKQAVDKLQEVDLTVEKEEAKLIQEKVDKYYENLAKVAFEKKSGKTKFKDLPPAVQTAIYSLNYHIGQIGPATIKKAVNGLKTGVWGPFIDEVENWHGSGQNVPQWKKDRRKKEADYLRKYLKNYNKMYGTKDHLDIM